MYCLFSSSSLYIGKALLQRAQGKLGLPSRINEPLTSILHTESAAARSIKAILLRKCPPATLCFLPGRHDWIKASGTIAIRVLRPNGNQGQCKPRRTNRHRRRGRRPPPRFRKRTSGFLWSLPFCLTQIIRQAHRNCTCLQRSRLPIWTLQSLKEAYRRKQQWVLATHGKAGPLSVYSRRNGGLLTLWTWEKGSNLDLRQLLRRQRPETAVLRFGSNDTRLCQAIPWL